jgi:hypothetical protein
VFIEARTEFLIASLMNFELGIFVSVVAGVRARRSQNLDLVSHRSRDFCVHNSVKTGCGPSSCLPSR